MQPPFRDRSGSITTLSSQTDTTAQRRNLSEEALIALAGDVGLDPEKFAADLNAPATAEVIATNQNFGLELGATSTPMFVLRGKADHRRAQPTEVFEDAFQAALDSAR